MSTITNTEFSGLVLAGDREQAAALRAMMPGLRVRAFSDLRPAEMADGHFCLVVSIAGPPDWTAGADVYFADRLYWGRAASVRWLYVPELSKRVEDWPRAGLGPAEWSDLLATAPLVHPPLPDDPPPPEEEAEAADRPMRYVDWREHTLDNYLDKKEAPSDPILKGSLFRGDTGLIVAPGGTGKGFGATQLGACLAAGRPFFGLWEVPRPFRVMYLSAEESEATVRGRARGAVERLGLDPAASREVAKRYLGLSIRGLGNPQLVRSDRRGGLEKTLTLADLYQQVAEFQPDLVFLDHFAKFVPVNEIDNSALTMACGFLEELAVSGRCAVILLHHANKGGPVFVRKPDDLYRSLDPSAIRGGSSLAANVRWALMMAPLSTEYAARVLGPGATGPAGTYVAARVAKKNEGRSEGIFYLKHDEDGFFVPAGASEADSGPEADARRLAKEVCRRELDLSARPLSETGAREAFGWGFSRTRRAVGQALDMGLLKLNKGAGTRGNTLGPGQKLS